MSTTLTDKIRPAYQQATLSFLYIYSTTMFINSKIYLHMSTGNASTLEFLSWRSLASLQA